MWRRRRAKALGLQYEGHLRGLGQPAQAGFVRQAEGFSSTGLGRCRRAEALGSINEGHRRGLGQPAQAGFVRQAEGFSPTG